MLIKILFKKSWPDKQTNLETDQVGPEAVGDLFLTSLDLSPLPPAL